MSKNMMKRTLGLLAVGCVLACISSAQAEVISSSEFSLGYGFTTSSTTNGWTTSETSGFNTPTTIGDFTFLPTLVGGKLGSTGPKFTDRVLAGSSLSGYCGYSSDTATKIGFGVSIAGSWAGATPPDAAVDPDYHIQLNITSLRIWGAGHPGWYGTAIAFEEETVGHEATSSYLTVPVSAEGYKAADGYLQLVWDPADYATEGTAFARAFDLDTTGGFCAVDGFEVFGTIDVTYTVIPEPSTMALLATGLIGLLCYAWRKRK